MRIWMAPVLALALTMPSACGGDSGDDDGDTPDARVNTPDAAANVPDADPNAPDADPNAPDARPPADADPNAPDADPSAPDAMTGNPDAAVGCTGGLTMCPGIGCVDLNSNDNYCGTCSMQCTGGQSCVLGGCVSGVGELVISEVHAFQPAYFEIYNGGSSSIDLAGHLIQWSSDNNVTGSVSLPTYNLSAGGWVVLREGSGSSGNGTIYLGDSIGWTGGVGVQLLAPGGAALDFVKTGTSTATPPAGTTWTGGTADNPSASLDQSLVRNVFVADTNSAADWTLSPVSSPGDYCPLPGRCGDECYDFSSDPQNCGSCGFTCGGSQLCVDGECIASGSGPWISEYRLFPRPMVELHNPTSSPITLTGYQLNITGATDTMSYTFPAFTLLPGGFVAVYMGDGTPTSNSLFAGAVRAFGFDVAITLYDDSTTNALDFVRFGSSTEAAPAGAPWFGNNVATISNLHDRSARRDLEKVDTNSNADWVLDDPATPGFACYNDLKMCGGHCRDLSVDNSSCGNCGTSCGSHESCVSGSCASVGKVAISELRNSSPEGIEIFNGTNSTVDLEGWAISWSADGGNGSHTIPAGVSLAPGQFLHFYEGSGSPSGQVRYLGTNINWSTRIAVTLSDDTPTEVDFVRTGDSVTSGTWTGMNTPNPSQSLSRHVYANDTNTNVDWYEASVSPTRLCPSSSESVCGSTCANLNTDANNCGRCGNMCGPSGVCYQGDCVYDGAIRLIADFGSDGPHQGHVHVFRNNKWYEVYSVVSASQAAFSNIVCQQLGYPAGSWYSTTRYGNGTCPGDCDRILNVTCDGSEARLLDCTYGTSTSEAGAIRVTCLKTAP